MKDERSKDIGSLPFPVLADNSAEEVHYKKFAEVYKTKTQDVSHFIFVIVMHT